MISEESKPAIAGTGATPRQGPEPDNAHPGPRETQKGEQAEKPKCERRQKLTQKVTAFACVRETPRKCHCQKSQVGKGKETHSELTVHRVRARGAGGIRAMSDHGAWGMGGHGQGRGRMARDPGRMGGRAWMDGMDGAGKTGHCSKQDGGARCRRLSGIPRGLSPRLGRETPWFPSGARPRPRPSCRARACRRKT